MKSVLPQRRNGRKEIFVGICEIICVNLWIKKSER